MCVVHFSGASQPIRKPVRPMSRPLLNMDQPFPKSTCPHFRGKKNHFNVLEPGTSKISIRTSIYFHPMSDGKSYSARLYVLEWSALFGNRTSKTLGVLVYRTSDHFKKFLPLQFIPSPVDYLLGLFKHYNPHTNTMLTITIILYSSTLLDRSIQYT